MLSKSFQKTKIIATIGPASSSYENLLSLVKAGVDIFRLNFSHGTHDEHLEVIERIHSINEKYTTHIGILADLQGPKLRVGKIEFNALEINEGDILTFVNEECLGTKEAIYMSYPSFATDVKPGEKVLIDDGKIMLEVVETDNVSKVKLKVLFGGILSSNKGVNLPDTKIKLPSLTEKDRRDLAFILTQKVNWIALSFVRSPKDIKDLKKIVRASGHAAKIIAKIEKPEGVKKIKEIVKASNAIMVARGDLGVEVPIEKMPGIQKRIIKLCVERARPVIVATQMMDSMITNINPTRAEVTDVANAVLDGTDAVMLSGETSVGRHPAKVVEAMSKIIEETEKYYDYKVKKSKTSVNSSTFYSDIVCFNAAKTAEDIGAKAIVGLTKTGYTAFKVSSYRPKTDIFMFSDDRQALAMLNLVWGVRCFYYDKFTTTDETIEDITEILRNNGIVVKGDVIINTGSMPIQKRLRTNMLKLTIVD